ncbi:hypothetical protein AB0F72_19980 [Actinoplanes sp. NPDC023936]|uniref:hypothetical protein n=1 Tax=Actinoplanes sp. NPDC023936 TaxID=3154910 RepID=UPI00340CD4BF
MMDLGNPVLKLCQEGMQAEAEGRLPDARALFEQAWAARTDDYDACVAAHYLARRQDDPAEILRWNQEALRHADAVGDDRVAAFYPSLLVGVAMAHEQRGDTAPRVSRSSGRPSMTVRCRRVSTASSCERPPPLVFAG